MPVKTSSTKGFITMIVLFPTAFVSDGGPAHRKTESTRRVRGT